MHDGRADAHTTRTAKPRGFSLLEAMVALALSALIAASVVATFKGALDDQGKSKHEWIAFTIAQQTMERLSAASRNSAVLAENDPGRANPGQGTDLQCDLNDPLTHFRVDEFGVAAATGVYDLCWKITADAILNVRNLRVLVTYPSETGTSHVLLQTLR